MLACLSFSLSCKAATAFFAIDGSGTNAAFGANYWKVEYDSSLALDGFDLLVAVFGEAEVIAQGGAYWTYRVGDASGNHAILRDYSVGGSNPNFIVNSITMNGQTLVNDPIPANWQISWSQHVDGGSYGYPFPEADDALNEWDFGAGISSPYRVLANGAYEYLYFNGMPSGDPSDYATLFANAPTVYFMVPEASKALLMMLGVTVLGMQRRRASVTR